MAARKPIRNDLSAEYVRSALDYDPATGIFTWRQRADRKPHWNRRFAGTRAGFPNEKGIGKNRPYHLIWLGGTPRKAHRLAWLWMTGEWPPLQIDHINGDSLDNRWANLRLATAAQNAANAGMYANNTVGFKGVSPHKCGYQARIGINGRLKALGVYKTPEEAHDAYMREARRVFGEFARGK